MARDEATDAALTRALEIIERAKLVSRPGDRPAYVVEQRDIMALARALEVLEDPPWQPSR